MSSFCKCKRLKAGWDFRYAQQVTAHDAARDGFSLEETIDFMQQMGAMVGYAVTVVCEPSNAADGHQRAPDADRGGANAQG
jgi:4-hydroxy-4-methyl-2-oxoglutarate aldolase